MAHPTLIVDHDMSLIMRLCHRIAVLNKGQLIALGSPAEIQASAPVREAYLGRRHAQILETAIVPLKGSGRK
jgi:branched-chain amino acid transport system permease protein